MKPLHSILAPNCIAGGTPATTSRQVRAQPALAALEHRKMRGTSKRLSAIIITSIFLYAGSSFADDMPVKHPVIPPPSADCMAQAKERLELYNRNDIEPISEREKLAAATALYNECMRERGEYRPVVDNVNGANSTKVYCATPPNCPVGIGGPNGTAVVGGQPGSPISVYVINQPNYGNAALPPGTGQQQPTEGAAANTPGATSQTQVTTQPPSQQQASQSQQQAREQPAANTAQVNTPPRPTQENITINNKLPEAQQQTAALQPSGPQAAVNTQPTAGTSATPAAGAIQTAQAPPQNPQPVNVTVNNPPATGAQATVTSRPTTGATETPRPSLQTPPLPSVATTTPQPATANISINPPPSSFPTPQEKAIQGPPAGEAHNAAAAPIAPVTVTNEPEITTTAHPGQTASQTPSLSAVPALTLPGNSHTAAQPPAETNVTIPGNAPANTASNPALGLTQSGAPSTSRYTSATAPSSANGITSAPTTINNKPGANVTPPVASQASPAAAPPATQSASATTNAGTSSGSSAGGSGGTSAGSTAAQQTSPGFFSHLFSAGQPATPYAPANNPSTTASNQPSTGAGQNTTATAVQQHPAIPASTATVPITINNQPPTASSTASVPTARYQQPPTTKYDNGGLTSSPQVISNRPVTNVTPSVSAQQPTSAATTIQGSSSTATATEGTSASGIAAQPQENQGFFSRLFSFGHPATPPAPANTPSATTGVTQNQSTAVQPRYTAPSSTTPASASAPNITINNQPQAAASPSQTVPTSRYQPQQAPSAEYASPGTYAQPHYDASQPSSASVNTTNPPATINNNYPTAGVTSSGTTAQIPSRYYPGTPSSSSSTTATPPITINSPPITINNRGGTQTMQPATAAAPQNAPQLHYPTQNPPVSATSAYPPVINNQPTGGNATASATAPQSTQQLRYPSQNPPTLPSVSQNSTTSPASIANMPTANATTPQTGQPHYYPPSQAPATNEGKAPISINNRAESTPQAHSQASPSASSTTSPGHINNSNQAIQSAPHAPSHVSNRSSIRTTAPSSPQAAPHTTGKARATAKHGKTTTHKKHPSKHAATHAKKKPVTHHKTLPEKKKLTHKKPTARPKSQQEKQLENLLTE